MSLVTCCYAYVSAIRICPRNVRNVPKPVPETSETLSPKPEKQDLFWGLSPPGEGNNGLLRYIREEVVAYE